MAASVEAALAEAAASQVTEPDEGLPPDELEPAEMELGLSELGVPDAGAIAEAREAATLSSLPGDDSSSGEACRPSLMGRLLLAPVRLLAALFVLLDIPFAKLSNGIKRTIGVAGIATAMIAAATWLATLIPQE